MSTNHQKFDIVLTEKLNLFLLTDSMAKTVLSETVATMGGKIATKAATNLLVGWILGVGNAVNAAVAAGVTESLGWLIAEDFDRESQRYGY